MFAKEDSVLALGYTSLSIMITHRYIHTVASFYKHAPGLAPICIWSVHACKESGFEPYKSVRDRGRHAYRWVKVCLKREATVVQLGLKFSWGAKTNGISRDSANSIRMRLQYTESPGATRRRQGVERAKTLVIFANSIKTSKASIWQLIIPKSDVYEKDE